MNAGALGAVPAAQQYGRRSATASTPNARYAAGLTERVHFLGILFKL